MSISLTLWLLTASAPFTVAAPGFRCGGVDPTICDAYLDHFSSRLTRAGRVAVRTRGDLQQLLGVERQRELLGCDDTSCLSEIFGGLGVDAVLAGGVTRTDSGYIATLRLLRARDGQEVAVASQRFASSGAMEAWLEEQAEVFADRIDPERGKAAPTNRPRLALTVGGAVLLAAGVALFAWSKADAAALRGSVTASQVDQLVARGSVVQPLGVALGVAGLLALAAGLTWLALPDGTPSASVVPAGGSGAMLSLTGRLP